MKNDANKVKGGDEMEELLEEHKNLEEANALLGSAIRTLDSEYDLTEDEKQELKLSLELCRRKVGNTQVMIEGCMPIPV